MNKIDSITFRKLINDAEIAFMGTPTKESLNYMPYGTQIRDALYSKTIDLLNENGYEKVILSDFVKPSSLNEIDKISKISSGYMKIENKDLMIAAGHEVNAYIYIHELLKHHYQNINLPIKIYNLGPVFRENKNTKFPFNLGERKSFLECYAVFKTSKEAEKELLFAQNWNKKIIKEILHIPSVEIIRPISTNKKISKKTICIDSITPLEETIITGMTYFHDDIFTKALNLKYKDQLCNKNKLTYSVHFGISENILFSYLINSCTDNGLRLYSFLAPIQVSILDTTNDKNCNNIVKNLLDILKNNNIRFKIEKIGKKKITSMQSKNNLKGIPVTIILKENLSQLEMTIYHFEKQLFYEQNNLNFNQIIKKIKSILRQNDEEIKLNLNLKEKENIIICNDINELKSIVMQGKIAKIHVESSEENVHKIESYLNGGEVLGFGLNKEIGKDILTGDEVDTIAYVSRRS